MVPSASSSHEVPRSPLAPDSRHEPPNLLIIGDWVVDEYWRLVSHHSDISSHTGFLHYRCAYQPGEIYIDLCGAGHVARVLYQLRSKCCGYRIVGLGDWHPDDTELMRHLVHAREPGGCNVAEASFRLLHKPCSQPIDLDLKPIGPKGLTTTVVRLYQQSEAGIRQLSRIDWEHPLDAPSIQVDFSAFPGAADMIVVHDLRKGLVSDDVIRHLKETYPAARWYVRTKALQPWLESVRDRLELLFLAPHGLGASMPWEHWLHEQKPTLPILDALRELPGEAVVLVSENREVVGRLRLHDICVTSESVRIDNPIAQVGWSSALFAALIFEMHRRPGTALAPRDVEEALKYASAASETRASQDGRGRPIVTPAIRATSWEEERRTWEQAQDNLGIISEAPGKPRLEVWRGCTVPGYVACIQEKRDKINQLGKRLRAFKHSRGQRSLSFLLRADPGAGKTLLAKTLADEFGFSLVRWDVTQILRRDELLDLFDKIATQQASGDQPVLVFVDEINAFLEGNFVYGSFLAPLEEGTYSRRGQIYSLKPCIWLFAATVGRTSPSEVPDKVSDFESRLTKIYRFDYQTLQEERKRAQEAREGQVAHVYVDTAPVQLPYRDRKTSDLPHEARLEQVYLGAMMIHREYPDIDRVSKSVLKHFHDFPPETSPARQMRGEINALRNVQYGTITGANWEKPLLEKRGDDELVRLVF